MTTEFCDMNVTGDLNKSNLGRMRGTKIRINQDLKREWGGSIDSEFIQLFQSPFKIKKYQTY